jgi:hypothetical protein
VNEESTEVESVPEGVQTSVEVGFDIWGLTPNLKSLSTKASPEYI